MKMINRSDVERLIAGREWEMYTGKNMGKEKIK